MKKQISVANKLCNLCESLLPTDLVSLVEYLGDPSFVRLLRKELIEMAGDHATKKKLTQPKSKSLLGKDLYAKKQRMLKEALYKRWSKSKPSEVSRLVALGLRQRNTNRLPTFSNLDDAIEYVCSHLERVDAQKRSDVAQRLIDVLDVSDDAYDELVRRLVTK